MSGLPEAVANMLERLEKQRQKKAEQSKLASRSNQQFKHPRAKSVPNF